MSKHLQVLERALLITRGRDAQFRPCRMNTAPLDAAVDWITRHRQIRQERFDRLEWHCRTTQQTQKTQPQKDSPT